MPRHPRPRFHESSRNGHYLSIDPGSYVDLIDPARRPLGVVVKSARSSVAGDWPKLLAAWPTIGVFSGAALGWLAYKRFSRQLSFPSTLQRAITRRKIDVVFQPIVRLEDNQCAGVEARVRWTLNGRAISPEVFVRVAEDNHLIEPLTDLVLEKAIAQLGKLLTANPAFHVSINVGAEDLAKWLGKHRAPREANGMLASQS